MECHGDHCEYQELAEETEESYSISEAVTHQCEIYKQLIYSEDLNTPVVAEGLSSCTARDLQCKLRETLMIWDKQIIHECPLYQINTVIGNVKKGLVTAENLAFKITKRKNISDCGIMTYETTEGVLLSTDLKAETIEKSNLEFQDNFHLLLGDMDARSAKILNLFSKWNTDANSYICNILRSILKVVERQNNDYFTLYDANGDEMIFYNNYGEIVTAKCVAIDKIIPEVETENNYVDIPVEITLNNRKVK
jgi:hypothetical protein